MPSAIHGPPSPSASRLSGGLASRKRWNPRTASESEPPRDDVSLHFGCARIDRAGDRVAERPFDFELDHVSISPVDLHTVERSFDERLTDKQLDDGSVE